MSLISVVIPNFNGQKYLKCCLDSLLDQTHKDLKIIVVDNNSNDDSVNFISENYTSVEVIKLDNNYGFSKAVNIGISESLNDSFLKYIVLLNNDVECDKNFIKELLKGFKTVNIGSVASKMLDYYDRKKIDNTGLFLNLRDFPYLRGNKETDTGQYDKNDFIFGCCAGAGMYSREVFEKTGLFDEDFFAYNEDIDLDIRMQLLGFRTLYNSNAICYHIGSATSVHNSPFKVYLGERNIVLLRMKNYPFWINIKNIPFYLYYTSKRFINYYRKDSFSTFRAAIKGLVSGLFFSKKYLFKSKNGSKDFKLSFGDIEFMPLQK